MTSSLENAPDIPQEWIVDMQGEQKDQLALDLYRRVHNLKVLEQRKAFKEFFGFDADDYPSWQTEEYIKSNY